MLPLLDAAERALAKRRAAGRASFLRTVLHSVRAVVGLRPPSVLPSVPPALSRPRAHVRGPRVLKVKGEGHCTVATQLWLPTSDGSGGSGAAAARVVLYIGRKDSSGELSRLERARVDAMRKLGLTVATPDLCGFGPLGGECPGWHTSCAPRSTELRLFVC